MKKVFYLIAVSLLIQTAACKKAELLTQDYPESTRATETFAIKSHGHVIGINGKQETEFTNAICTTATNLKSAALQQMSVPYGTTCGISFSVTSGGGQCIEVLVRDQPYRDGNSLNSLWTSLTGIGMEKPLIPGGITANDVIPLAWKTFCSYDTTGAIEGITVFTAHDTLHVPSSFQCLESLIKPKGKKH